jgi:GT2 family glycosyltransferase
MLHENSIEDSAASEAPLVYIIILNWNGWTDTIECLDSVFRMTYPRFKVVVCDNNSRDGSMEHLRTWASNYMLVPSAMDSSLDGAPPVPGTTTVTNVEYSRTEAEAGGQASDKHAQLVFIQTGANLGFAGGNNVGIRYARQHGADYILLLNNDTVVEPGMMEPLVECLTHQPRAGIAGSLICYADKPEHIWFAGARADFGLGCFGHRHVSMRREDVGLEPFTTDYITGCCMLIDAEVFNAIGMLDEQLFAYFEDVDFCMRARRKGFESLCIPKSVIWHKVSASTRKGLVEGNTSPLKHYLMTRNRIITIRCYGGSFDVLLFFLVSILTTAYYLIGFLLYRRWTKMVWLCIGVVHGIQYKTSSKDMNSDCAGLFCIH